MDWQGSAGSRLERERIDGRQGERTARSEIIARADFIMKVRCAGFSCSADRPQALALFYADAFTNGAGERGEMRIPRVNAVSVVDDDHVAVIIPVLRFTDHAVGGGEHIAALIAEIVDAAMRRVTAMTEAG